MSYDGIVPDNVDHYGYLPYLDSPKTPEEGWMPLTPRSYRASLSPSRFSTFSPIQNPSPLPHTDPYPPEYDLIARSARGQDKYGKATDLLNDRDFSFSSQTDRLHGEGAAEGHFRVPEESSSLRKVIVEGQNSSTDHTTGTSDGDYSIVLMPSKRSNPQETNSSTKRPTKDGKPHLVIDLTGDNVSEDLYSEIDHSRLHSTSDKFWPFIRELREQFRKRKPEEKMIKEIIEKINFFFKERHRQYFDEEMAKMVEIHDKASAEWKVVQKGYTRFAEAFLYNICISNQNPLPRIANIPLYDFVNSAEDIENLIKIHAPALYRVYNLSSNKLLVVFLGIRAAQRLYTEHTEDPWFELSFTIPDLGNLRDPFLAKDATTKLNSAIFQIMYMPIFLKTPSELKIDQRFIHDGIIEFLRITGVNKAFHHLLFDIVSKKVERPTLYDVMDIIHQLIFNRIPELYPVSRGLRTLKYEKLDKETTHLLCDLFVANDSATESCIVTDSDELKAWLILAPFMKKEDRIRWICFCYRMQYEVTTVQGEDYAHTKSTTMFRAGLKQIQTFSVNMKSLSPYIKTIRDDINRSASNTTTFCMYDSDRFSDDANTILQRGLESALDFEITKPNVLNFLKRYIDVESHGLHKEIMEKYPCLRRERNALFEQNWIRLMVKSVKNFNNALPNDIIETITHIILSCANIQYTISSTPYSATYKKRGHLKRSQLKESLRHIPIPSMKPNELTLRVWRIIVPFVDSDDIKRIDALYFSHYKPEDDMFKRRLKFIDLVIDDYVSNTWLIRNKE